MRGHKSFPLTYRHVSATFRLVYRIKRVSAARDVPLSPITVVPDSTYSFSSTGNQRPYHFFSRVESRRDGLISSIFFISS